MRTFLLWALALTIYAIGVDAEDNSTCVEEEEYPPGGGGGYPPPGKDGKQPPKQGWPNPGCSGKWKSKWTTWTTSTSTYTSSTSTSSSTLSSSSTSSSSSSSSATPTTPAVTFRNGLFYQNLYVAYSQEFPCVQADPLSAYPCLCQGIEELQQLANIESLRNP